MTFLKSFASDNNAPVHDAVIRAVSEANAGDAIGYGDDLYTLEAEQKFKKMFGPDSRAFFVFNGTGANVSAISHLSRSYHAIVCSDKAHVHHDECGAPEKFCGSKVLTLAAPHGKITPDQIKPLLHSVGFQHHAQPKIVSITQATELGTVYTLEEIMALGRFTDDYDMILHMDGARIANAAASLNVPMIEMVTNAGVDVLSFGGTKNGMMLGEAVVFLNPSLAREYEYTRKQSMQLASKMRYISAQFNALLSNELWLKNALHANKMAQKLALALAHIPEVTITQEVETNAVFAILPPEAIERLLHKYFFYTWDETKHEVRWMTAFNTTEQDVNAFVQAVKDAVKPLSAR
jgi:threonine aldolase